MDFFKVFNYHVKCEDFLHRKVISLQLRLNNQGCEYMLPTLQ
jgi:hypothetical protein